MVVQSFITLLLIRQSLVHLSPITLLTGVLLEQYSIIKSPMAVLRMSNSQTILLIQMVVQSIIMDLIMLISPFLVPNSMVIMQLLEVQFTIMLEL